MGVEVKKILARQVILVILDGWGHREEKTHNAVAHASKPCFDYLWRNYPHALLEASGEAIGLPPGQIGTSEHGHLTIGAGRTIDSDLVRITKAFKSGAAENNPVFQKLFNHVKKYTSSLHIKGLVSPGGVHSHSEHLYELLRMAKKAGVEKVVLHAFTDGRDTPPQSAERYLTELETIIESLGIGYIATVSGRFYAMDRDHNWHRTAKVEKAIFECRGKICRARKPSKIMRELYREGTLDEHLEPLIFLDDKDRSYPIEKNDGVVFINFRPERARQLAQKVAERAKTMNLFFVTMTHYGEAIDSHIAFPQIETKTCLSNEVSKAGLSQVHIGETEKPVTIRGGGKGGQCTPNRVTNFHRLCRKPCSAVDHEATNVGKTQV